MFDSSLTLNTRESYEVLVVDIEGRLATTTSGYGDPHHGLFVDQQKKQNVHAEKRAELEYEVNVRSYRKIRDLQDTLEAIANRIERPEKREK
ncbi:MAG: hypothetical protein ACREXS_20805 [Gammaproteobacteria bacterium]